MGCVKGRFASLRGLRQQIDDSKDHERALAWVKACIIIHTLVGLIEDGTADDEYLQELIQEGLANQAPAPLPPINTEAAAAMTNSRGQRKCIDVKTKLFASGAAEDRE
ncbi:hypothetical protein C8F04DRAFT_1190189 [Mycena alexandri]|uniref:DDE Tnp4 domain-containing protein n=1 Tax=Mycena alexandri TaxID=1745969 RepID=A0AAD6WXB6_9AGAR|nr:hypothetical protein C8F04DRAFT_1190189 [Mycena alexandri]